MHEHLPYAIIQYLNVHLNRFSVANNLLFVKLMANATDFFTKKMFLQTK